MSCEMSGFEGTQQHIPTVRMILNHDALNPVWRVSLGASATPLCTVTLRTETFWNKEVKMLIKAGSTDGLVGSCWEDRPIGGPSDSY